MESKDYKKISERYKALLGWLSDVYGTESISLKAMIKDASFRNYYRLSTTEGTVVVMDAPRPQEDCEAYVVIAKTLRKQGLNVPEIIAENLEQGFLLITDFGDSTYLKTLHPENVEQLYYTAIEALVILQKIREVPGRTLPIFSREFMWQEWIWFKEWFIEKFLNLTLGDNEQDLVDCYHLLVEFATSQPQIFMHRDFHSANLMVLPHQQVGILDFQDAFMGPVTYDLASLLRDCYIDWPEQKVRVWAKHYWQRLCEEGALTDVDQQEFLYWFDKMSMQRHLKALMTFVRKYVRDQQSQYLKYIPRTLRYLQMVSARYSDFALLHDYLSKVIEPTWSKVMPLCAP